MNEITKRHLSRLLPVDRWPTRAEAASMRWFSPVRVGSFVARTRTWVPAMVPWRATGEGEVSEAVLDWYGRFARGRPGVLVVEATGVRDIPSGPLLRIGHDRFLPGLNKLVERVREESDGQTRLLIQIIDFLPIRRRPPREKFLQRFATIDEALGERFVTTTGKLLGDQPREDLLALTDSELSSVLSERDWESLTRGYRERVTDVHLPAVRDLPQTLPPVFANAARRAKRAGFDGVELHYAHAYTMASFLSRLNTRGDGYGVSLEGRVRLPTEVALSVREAVGPGFTVGARILGDEVVAGGSPVEDAAWFAVKLAESGLDFISVSKGGKFEDAKPPKVGAAVYPYTGKSGHECMPTVRIGGDGPFGRNVHLAGAVRNALRDAGHEIPVVAAGGISSSWQAEAILTNEDADIIASARQTLADPDWFQKIESGEGASIRRCFFTNYCEALDQVHKEVTCQRWDREFDSNTEVSLARDGKRRLVAPD